MALVDRKEIRAEIAGHGVQRALERVLDVVNPQVENAITAFATGGQASATQLTKTISRITVCATIADSVKLPAAKAGDVRFLVNSGAASANVFPATGETINALSANTALALAAGSKAAYFCPVDGAWFSLITA